ncbi:MULTISPECIES: ferritin-like domain-containing protein [Thioalkalivibrio]|uniref:Bacterioferritin n=1 Tax=Thioalkalivibrio halophilus TaxID=252474 RepID=A0A1V2ZYA7_9GAMM|nr:MULTISPECIES: ferritin-like domain-containing protein [Thioalkalivibrio]OOC10108.1 bacterioferritin [Thioalkalivibrio halophilus]
MADPRIVGYLNRAVAHEMSAVQQYMAQARLTALWGMAELSDSLRREAQEELEHADRLMTRLMHYGLAPPGGQLAPVRLGRSVRQLMEYNRALELDAVRMYEEAMAYCRRTGAREDAALFSALLDEEWEHVREIDAQMNANGSGDSDGRER